MSIHFELPEIPIPANARSDGDRVYVMADTGQGKTIKIYIGVYARKDDGTFYPNDKFRYYYPNLWIHHYGSKDVYPHLLAIGLYAATLAITHRLGLYDIAYKSFGPLYGNGILDYAMYSIKERSNVANLFLPAMAGSAVFSKDRNDDDWYADLFTNKITSSMILRFKELWIEQCRTNGVVRVWIAIDGSNSNCESEKTELAKEGNAKSHINIPIVSYIWAVSAEDGTPVTFFMNEGSTVDSKAFMEVCTFLSGHGMEIEGVILDRGFLTHDVLTMIRSAGYDYVVKMKSDTWALMQMFEKHWSLVYWKPEQLVSKGARFGVVTRNAVRLFSGHNDKAYVGLFFDGKNGSERRVALLDKMYEAMDAVRSQIESGNKPSVSDNMARYLTLEEVPETAPETSSDENREEKEEKGRKKKEDFSVECNEWSFEYEGKRFRIAANAENCDHDLKLKGIEGLASSRKMTAREMDAIYNLRDVSEKQFMVSKSMLGNSVFRSHSTQAIVARESVCFIAAIIRNDFMNACQSAGKKTARTIEDLDEKAYLILNSSGNYVLINKMTEGMKSVLKNLGINGEDLETLAGDINERMHANGIGVSQYHEMPKAIRKRYSKDRKAAEANAPEQDRQKETVTQPVQEEPAENSAVPEARTQLQRTDTTEKRSPGRPKGSRNKSTLEREARERAMGIVPPPKRHRGRPSGSRDSKPRTRRTKAQMQEAKLAK